MQIIQLLPKDKALIEQAAALLVEAFPQTQEWQSREGSLEEVQHVFDEGMAFAAVEGELLLGWIGCLSVYADNTWELHPLVVRKEQQRSGVGRALVETLEKAAQEAGVSTMMIGTDDEDFRTSLSQVDNLYDDLLNHIANIRNLDENNPHPFTFYQKCGYQVVGILPDANGPRKPDIFMAKSLKG